MLRRGVLLSIPTFVVSWEQADGVDDLPTPLFTRSPGSTDHERRQAEVLAVQELQRLGGRNMERFGEDLEDTYQILARAELEYYGWFVGAGLTTFSAMVGCLRGRAVLAVMDDEEVWLEPIDPSMAVERLVNLTPKWGPAQVRSLTVAASELFASNGNDDRSSVFDSLDTGSLNDLADLRDMLADTGTPTGKGQIYVALRTRNGRRIATQHPVNYIDPDHGRIVFHTSKNSTGHEWVSARSGTPQAIYDTIARAYRELADESGM